MSASAFNPLCQYAISPGNRVYCYTELGVPLVMTVTNVACSDCARNDSYAKLAWVAG